MSTKGKELYFAENPQKIDKFTLTLCEEICKYEALNLCATNLPGG